MKFLADMGISPKSVAHLRSLQYEAIHLHEFGLERLTDLESGAIISVSERDVRVRRLPLQKHQS